MKNKIILYGTSFGIQFLVTVAISVITVRYYSPEVAVTLFYNLNIVTFLSYLISLGIPQSLIRYQYIDEVNKLMLNQTVAYFGIVSFIFTIVCVVFFISKEAALLVFILPFTVSQYYLRSIERFNKFIALYFGRLLFLIIGGLVVYLSGTRNVWEWYIIVGGSYAVGLLFYPRIKNLKWDKKLFKDLVNYSFPLQLYTFLLQGVFLVGQTALDKFGSQSEFGEYVIAWRVIQVVQGVSALIFFFYPQFYFKNIDKHRDVVLKYQRYLVIGLILFSFSIILAKPVIDYILDYKIDYTLITILVLSETIRLVSGIMNTKFSYYMKNSSLLLILSVSVVCMLAFWITGYMILGFLNSMIISLGLLFCFSIYSIGTYVKSKQLSDEK